MSDLNSIDDEIFEKIFEIKLWNTDKTYKLYVFNATRKDTIKDKDADEIVVVPESIFFTDSINTIQYKIKKHLGIDVNILLTSTCSIDTDVLKLFVQSIFKNKLQIDESYFDKCCSQYFDGYKTSKKSSSLDIDEALDKLNNFKQMKRILNFKYQNNQDFEEILSPDPWNDYNELTKDSSLVSFENMLLFKFNLIEPKLNCYLEQSDINSFYFPNMSTLNMKKYETFVDDKRKLVSTFENIDSIIDTYSFYIDLLYFRVIPYSHDIELNMKNIFKIASVNDDIPIIIYRSKYTNEYKVNKFSIAKLDSKQLDIFKKQEQKYENIMINRTNETLIFYMRLFDNVFVYLLLSSNGSYKVKYKFNKSHNMNIEYISNNFDKVKNILQTFAESRMYILDNDTNIFDNKNVEIIDFNTHSSITFKKQVNNKYLKKQNVLFDFNKEEKNLLHLKFVEVNNFYNTDSVSSFIYKNIELDKVELINRLEQYFKIGTEEATSLYEEKRNKLKINISKKGKNVFAVKSYDTAVNVKVNILSDYSIKIITSNTQNIQYQRMIIYYLSQLLCNVNVHKLKSDKKIKNVEVVDLEDESKIDFNDILDFNDLDDVDLDDINELDIDMTSPVPNIEADVDALSVEVEDDVEYSDSGKKTDYTSFVLERLYKADPELFLWKDTSTKLKNYSSKCGAVNFRQPIVISKKEKDYIDKNHPKSYTGYVKTGSSEKLKEQNFYICPKIWCRISRVAMTVEEYEKTGNKCPMNEEALFFPKKGTPAEKNYFINKDGIEAHYPSLLNKNKHPKNLELPCCGKKPFKYDETKNKHTSHYVANIANNLLLDANQHGNLPYVLNLMLNKKSNCIGTIDAKTSCFVRTGVEQTNNALITIIENILNIKSLISVIDKKFEIQHFIFLNNGNALKAFANPEYQLDIFTKEKYQTFKKYFINNKEYIKQFNLEDEYKFVKNTEEIKDFANPLILSLMREFLIYRSFINFKAYLMMEDLDKTLDDIQHLLTYEVINPSKINFIFLSVEQDQVFFMNPKYYNHNHYLSDQGNVAIILKVDNHYEYVSYISQKKKTRETVSFEYDLINDLISSFSTPDERTVETDVSKYVLSSSFQCIGHLEGTIFVPYEEDVHLQFDKHVATNKLTYLDKLEKIKEDKKLSKDRNMEIIYKQNIQMNLELLTLPSKSSVESEDKSLFDKTLFNLATKFIKNQSLSNSLYVLNHEMTNFTKNEKHEILSKIIKKTKVNIPEEIIQNNQKKNHLFDSLLTTPLQHIIDHYKLKLINDDPRIVYLTFSDVLKDELENFKSVFNNKFKVIETTIGDYVEEVSYVKITSKAEIEDEIFNMKDGVKRINITPIRLRKLLGAEFLVIDKVLTYSNIISILNRLNKNLTAESATKAIEDQIKEQYFSNKETLINQLSRNINISRSDLRLMTSVQSVLEIITDQNYRYSLFELEILSKMAGCNIVILGRDTTIITNGIHFINNKAKENMLLHYTINDKQYDFRLIMNDTNKYFYKHTNLDKILELL